MTHITFLGLGEMGSRMVKHLIDANHNVCVWNRDYKRADALAVNGIRTAKTPKAEVKDAEIVISMLRDDDVSKSVWLDEQHGALTAMNEQSIAIDCSTLSINWTQELHRECLQRNINFLEAPVAGSRPQAETAQLVFFVGGELKVYDAAHPILNTMGNAVHYVGNAGSGTRLKLAVNALLATQVASIAEILSLFTADDVGMKNAIETIGSLPICSPAIKQVANAILAKQYTPMFPIELVEKDLSYAVRQLQSHDKKAPITTATHHVFKKAIEEGYAKGGL